MCWMMLIPLAISVVGGMQQGKQQEAAANSAAGQARQNAFFANDAANDAITRGRNDASLQRMRTASALGSQRAAMAENGGVIDADSNARLQEDTAMLGEMDALTIQNNAAREAYGYKVQAIQGVSNANALQTQGQTQKKNSILGGVMNGVGSMFGGGGGGGSMFGTGAGASSAGTYGTTGVAVNTAGYSAGFGSGR